MLIAVGLCAAGGWAHVAGEGDGGVLSVGVVTATGAELLPMLP